MTDHNSVSTTEQLSDNYRCNASRSWKPYLVHPWCEKCMHTVSRSWCYRILWAASECMCCWNSALASSSLAFLIWLPPWPIMSYWLASGVMPFPPVPIPRNDFAIWCTLPPWRQRKLILLKCQ